MTDMTSDQTPEWKKLEYLVVSIQKQLSPDASVQHNVMLDGIDSETKRQIDVLVEQNVGQYTIRIVIDCKDYSKPVDVKGIEEFQGLVQDVRAHKGALVCPSGFTKAALKRAKKLQIDLYRPVSTGKHKWQAKVTAPVLCDFRSSYMSFGIRCSAPKPLTLPQDFYNLSVQDEDGCVLGTALAAAQSKWDEGIFPSDPGEHEHVSIFGDTKVFIDNGYNDTIEVDLTVGLYVKQILYIGHLPIDDLSGLQDEHTGALVTNAFTTGGLNPEEVARTWKQVEDVDSLEFQPVFKLTGYDCYGVGT
ncbi:restriction endonuclease [Shewanella colwelliana]|uniref:restriction endonuclease n=1 Tax=Shewanella colwelliana TaxID=23 RepID=UPI0037359DB6